MSELADFIIARLQRQAPYAASEEATKQGLILPLLAQVGWSSSDVEQVMPEYPVGGGRVDYCLKLADQPRVFLEAKKSTEPLERHDGQLLEYAFKAGVKLAALTNGLQWRLYLPMAEGSWEQRLFFNIDLVSQPPEEVAAHFVQLLGRDAIASGAALVAAEAFRSEEVRKKTVQQFLPKAWTELLRIPDEFLVELVSEKVAQLSGISPTAQEVSEFLADKEGSRPAPEAPGPNIARVRTAPRPPPTPPASPLGSDSGSDLTGFVNQRPTGYELFGVETHVETFQDVLLGVTAELAKRYPHRIPEFLALRGRKRAYFARGKNELYEPRAIMGTDLWAETNSSANDIVRRCHSLLAICGHAKTELRVAASPRRPNQP